MPNSPRILFLDIETSPAIAYVWSLHDEHIPLERLIQPSRIICWAAKWLGEKEVYYDDERGGKKKMLKGIHRLMSESQAVCTFNGERFDLPKLDGAFIEYGLPPLPPVSSIDLWKTVSKFGYISSKLAFVGPHLEIGKKVEHEGFALWRSCMNGDKEAWSRMKEYNIRDVTLLEELYEAVKPYIRNHPFMGVGRGELFECPACTSTRYQRRGNRRTRAFVIERLQCLDCGHWFPGKRSQVKAAA